MNTKHPTLKAQAFSVGQPEYSGPVNDAVRSSATATEFLATDGNPVLQGGEDVIPTLGQSPLEAKMRILLVGVIRHDRQVQVACMHLVDFSRDPRVQKDFGAMAGEFSRLRRRLGAASAIDRLGAGTRGYGKKIVAKTKSSRRVPGSRRRAMYVRRAALSPLFATAYRDAPRVPMG